MNMKNLHLNNLLLCSLFGALALLAFMLESLFPPLIIPGAKLGVSNVFVLLSTIILGKKYGVMTLLVKVVLGSIFSGNPSAIIYSLPSGILALTIEIILLHFVNDLSVVAVSVAGAVVNISVQNVIFCFYTSTLGHLIYLPYLALVGIIGGTVTGLIIYLTIKNLPQSKLG